jgi:fatty acid desaturase
MIIYALAAVILGLVLHGIDYLYHKPSPLRPSDGYRDNDGYFRLSGEVQRRLRCKRLDNVLGLLPFIRTYLYICAAGMVFCGSNVILVKVLAVIYVGCRIRSLQEISHFALHGALCPSGRRARRWANIFYQYPFLLPSATTRHRTHIVEHHPNPNAPDKDPNLQDYISIGFIPGISARKFWRLVFYPLSFRGVAGKLRSYRRIWLEAPVVRTLTLAVIMLPFLVLNLWAELLCLYLIPAMVIHPFLAWVSQLVEHRGFHKIDSTSVREREYAYGRVIEFPGLLGWIVRHSVLPFGDSFHLMHSLYPSVRWNYMPTLHGFLKEHDNHYRRRSNSGIFFGRGNNVSALRDLMNDMVINPSAGIIKSSLKADMRKDSYSS